MLPPLAEVKESLLEFISRIQLFRYYLDASFSFSSPLLCDNRDSFLTLSDWLHYSVDETIRTLFSLKNADIKGVIDCTLQLNSVKEEMVVDYIVRCEGSERGGLLLGYVEYKKEKGVQMLLSQELFRFVEFLLVLLTDEGVHFSTEEIGFLREVVGQATTHPLLDATQQESLTLLLQCLTVLSVLGLTSPSIPSLASTLQADAQTCSSAPPLASASVEAITQLLSLQSTQLLTHHAQSLLRSQPAARVLQTLHAVHAQCFPFLPAGLDDYLIIPLLLKKSSNEALNAASAVSQKVQSAWLDTVILNVVDEEVKSMNTWAFRTRVTNRLDSRELQNKASFLNLVSKRSETVVSYQNYRICQFQKSPLVSTLALLASHTPTLSPLELSQCVSRWNLHSKEPPRVSFVTSPVVSTEAESSSPGDLLLSCDESFYRLSNSYHGDNSSYLCQILRDIGLNDYSIAHVVGSLHSQQ